MFFFLIYYHLLILVRSWTQSHELNIRPPFFEKDGNSWRSFFRSAKRINCSPFCSFQVSTKSSIRSVRYLFVYEIFLRAVLSLKDWKQVSTNFSNFLHIWGSNTFQAQRNVLTVFWQSLEACPSCFDVLVSRGEVLGDSWAIWRPQGPHCPVYRWPCRWPSSTMGLRLSQPRWH